MMGQTRNFREFYGVSDSLTLGKRAAEASRSAAKAASLAMEGESKHRGYSVERTNDPENIYFGRFSKKMGSMGTIIPSSEDFLTLSLDSQGTDFRSWPAVALRYGIYPKEIVIGYVQTHAFLSTLGPYQKMKEELEGVRPHEFLVAHFLARIAQTLDKHPKTGVFIAPHYLDKPVYPTLRDRFFDDNYSLNPNRERVQQILGEDNTWLTQDAIESRKERLEEIIEKRSQPFITSLFEMIPEMIGMGDLPRADWPELVV